MDLVLNVYVKPGEHIDKATAEVSELAKKLDVIVEFEFNGNRVRVYPDGGLVNLSGPTVR